MDARVAEFQCIMPLANIPSVLEHGILSHEQAARLAHQSVALQAVQDLRDVKRVPGGLKLHQYANLYFHARNPMLSKRRGEARSLCVLRVSTEVLNLDGVVLADSNASSQYVRFLAPSQWRLLAFDDIFAMNWKHPDDRMIRSQNGGTVPENAPRCWCRAALIRGSCSGLMSWMRQRQTG
ncbi:MAG: DarT ssDNA thymidine ADP-ribosyltransferase family protein [Verrucomicrobiales bacterium]